MSADLNKLEGLVGRLEMAVQRQEALYNKPGLSPKPTSIPPPAGGSKFKKFKRLFTLF